MNSLESLFYEQQQQLGQQASSDSSAVLNHDHVYIKFSLNGNLYVAPIVTIREVLEYRAIVPYPIAVDGHFGIINLRGSIVPIIDDDTKSTLNENKRIIIFESDKNGDLFGVIATQIKKVYLSAEQQKVLKEMIGTNEVITIDQEPYHYFDSNLYFKQGSKI